MKACPLCLSPTTYVGFNSLECSGVKCQNWNGVNPYPTGSKWRFPVTGIMAEVVDFDGKEVTVKLNAGTQLKFPVDKFKTSVVPFDGEVWNAPKLLSRWKSILTGCEYIVLGVDGPKKQCYLQSLDGRRNLKDIGFDRLAKDFVAC